MALIMTNDSKTKEELLHFLIEEYGQSVKRLAFTYVKDWSTADDIAQEVFIKCYQSIDNFRGVSAYKTWIYRITINNCKDMLKSKWYRNIFPKDFEKVGIKSSGDSPENHLIAKDEEIELAQVVCHDQLNTERLLYYFIMNG